MFGSLILSTKCGNVVKRLKTKCGNVVKCLETKCGNAEVKSSGICKHKSLDVFAEKYSGRIYRKYLISPKDLQKDKDIICLPVYMTMFL